MKKTLKQSTLNILLNGILIAFSVALIVFSIVIKVSFDNVKVMEARKTEFKQLGIDLANASDYLTNEARAYVQFGDKVYYDNYWREVNETKTRDKVVQRLTELNAPKDELALVQQAKQNSDALVKTEDEAMKAVEQKDFDKARHLMFDKSYDESKKIIMTPIQEFQNKMNTRAENELLNAQNKLNKYIYTMIVLISTMIAFFIANTLIYIKKIINPIIVLKNNMLSLANGDLTKKIDLPENSFEIGELTGIINTTVNNMKNLISAVKQGSVKVVENSNNLSSTMDETTQSIQGVAKAVDDMAHISTELAQNAQRGAQKLENLSQYIDDMNKISDEVIKKMEIAETATKNGVSSLEQLKVAVDNSEKVTGKVAEKITLLDEKSESVGKITDTLLILKRYQIQCIKGNYNTKNSACN